MFKRGADQGFRVIGLRIIKNLRSRSGFHDITFLHHHDAMAEGANNFQILPIT